MSHLRRWITSRMRPDRAWARALVNLYGSGRGVKVRFEAGSIVIRKETREIRLARTKFPYLRDMIAMFDSYYGAVEPDSNGVVDYSAPRVHRYRKSGVEFHLPSIAEEDEAIGTYLHWYQPRPGDLVFDLGAHAGVSTYSFSKAVGPAGRVYAFEPDPVAWTSLMRNIEHHGMTNVYALQKAIAGKRGRLAFQSEGSLGSALSSVASREGGNTMLVDAITFMDACEIAGGPPRFVKMDIEGAELAVIAAAAEYLRGKRIDFAADTNHIVDGNLTAERLERLFEEAGYESQSDGTSGFLTTWARAR